jgi:hypothetical protein
LWLWLLLLLLLLQYVFLRCKHKMQGLECLLHNNS